MQAFTLADLQAIAREVTGNPDITLAADMAAQDVPGWDSLNHTLICLELAARTGRDVDAQRLAETPTFGELVALVNAAPPAVA